MAAAAAAAAAASGSGGIFVWQETELTVE
eukprot:COSAG06_NODE_11136_length_1559_cov_2.714384_2_plen_28_part_01